VWSAVLAAARGEGWAVVGDEASVAEARVVVLRRENRDVSVAVWPDEADVAVVGIGDGGCTPAGAEQGVAAEESVYLEGVPVPPASILESFVFDADKGHAVETWRGECLDLDLAAAALAARLAEEGWSTPPGTTVRAPGLTSTTAAPADDSASVSIEALVHQDRSLSTMIERDGSGRRVPRGSSLLFDDLPLPAGSAAIRLVTNTHDGWAYEEKYSLPDALDAADYFRAAMADRGWRRDRSHEVPRGAADVYFAGGVEVVVHTAGDDSPTVELKRRRICPSGEPTPPAGEGLPARRLEELRVYPGSVYLRFEEGEDGGSELYDVRCTSLDFVAGWYRRILEQGSWSLAGTVGPEDRFHRELTFVRPDERLVPPAERSAWARVTLDRFWPYQIELRLQRDPGGVLPGGAALHRGRRSATLATAPWSVVESVLEEPVAMDALCVDD